MIFLDPSTPKIVNAKNLHVSALLPIICERVNELLDGPLKAFLSDERVENILSDLPQNLERHHTDLLEHLEGVSVQIWQEYLRIKRISPKKRNNPERILFNDFDSNFVRPLNEIFKYTGAFARKSKIYNTYDLAANLDIPTCVYCNRIYTKTVKNPKKITRPEFDHWFPKSTYPILALSFYNLIPSCHVCNSSVKGTIVMDLSNFLHPYVDKVINMRFSYWLNKYDKYEFKINRPANSKEDFTIRAFKLEEIYKTHEDEIVDLVRIKRLYSVDYLLRLRDLLKKVDKSVSIEELYRLAFGAYYQEENFHLRPLSKMKKDLLKELSII